MHANPFPARTALVIDDEPQIRRVVRNALADDFARVLEADTASRGLDLAASEQPQLVVLDLGLPDAPGLSVCRQIRSWSQMPIVVLSARQVEQEKVELLDAGADDYVTKPFGTMELQARIRAVLRRSSASEPAGEHRIAIGSLVIDLAADVVTRDGNFVHLTRTEWGVLRTLIAHRGKTLTHRQLFNEVWSGRSAGDAQQYLRVYIANLRRKIEADSLSPVLILTEPGVGYRFAAKS